MPAMLILNEQHAMNNHFVRSEAVPIKPKQNLKSGILI